MEWEGGQIKHALWQQILAFFIWSYKEFKSETQVRLFYHRDSRRWAAWAFPQRPTGMTTNEIADHPDVSLQRAQFPDPWILLGTVHHHCNIGAFQSGTDRSNEDAQEGLHMTVGYLEKDTLDLHGRVIVRNTQYDCGFDHWFELPEVAAALPVKLHDILLKFFLTQPPPADTAFPEQWKTNCIRPAPTTSMGFHQGRMPVSGGAVTYPRQLTLVRTDLRAQFTPIELEFMGAVDLLLTQERITQTALDSIMFGDHTTIPLNAKDMELFNEVFKLAAKGGIVKARVDELIDKWDFETVLKELKAPGQHDIAPVLSASATNPNPPFKENTGLVNVK